MKKYFVLLIGALSFVSLFAHAGSAPESLKYYSFVLTVDNYEKGKLVSTVTNQIKGELNKPSEVYFGTALEYNKSSEKPSPSLSPFGFENHGDQTHEKDYAKLGLTVRYQISKVGGGIFFLFHGRKHEINQTEYS